MKNAQHIHLETPETPQKILVGVSGGLDSVVLAHALYQAGYHIVVAHVNFKLRGADADADAVFVEGFAKALEVPFLQTETDTRTAAQEVGVSVQMAARDFRRTWLSLQAAQYGADKIALAHHADDQAETILLNLIRGSGPLGLAGMAEQEGIWWRPLLPYSKAQLREYALFHGLKWREDASNASNKYLRNALRNEIIPQLNSYREGATRGILKSGYIQSGVAEIVSWAAGFLGGECVQTKDECQLIEIEKLEKLPGAESLLFQLLMPYGFSTIEVHEMWQSRSRQSGAEWSSPTHHVLRDRGQFIIYPIAEIEFLRVQIDAPRPCWVEHPFNVNIKMADASTYEVQKTATIAQLDADQLQFPLTFRGWKPGDRIKPLGMKGAKKVSDILIDAKVPLHLKRKVFVVQSGADIVWVAGHCIHHNYRLRSTSKHVFICKPTT